MSLAPLLPGVPEVHDTIAVRAGDQVSAPHLSDATYSEREREREREKVTSLIRPHLFYGFLVVSRTIRICGVLHRAVCWSY